MTRSLAVIRVEGSSRGLDTDASRRHLVCIPNWSIDSSPSDCWRPVQTRRVICGSNRATWPRSRGSNVYAPASASTTPQSV